MRTSVIGVMIALAFAAGAAFAQEDAAGEDAALNSYLGITVYPGSVLLSQDTETEFESSAGLQEIYAFIHDQLVELGWERSNLTENADEIEARYSREGENLRVDLERESDTRYDLETTFDD